MITKYKQNTAVVTLYEICFGSLPPDVLRVFAVFAVSGFVTNSYNLYSNVYTMPCTTYHVVIYVGIAKYASYIIYIPIYMHVWSIAVGSIQARPE